MTDNPSRQLIGSNRTSTVPAKIVLTCCPVRDEGRCKKRVNTHVQEENTLTHTHTPNTHTHTPKHTKSKPYADTHRHTAKQGCT